ncbi:Ger(x)C family spore germination protein [Caldicellulosiruptoraceae bacterium PP1]
MIKKILIICIIINLILLTSCWDRVEIEDRGYVIAIGIDKYDVKDLNKYQTTKYIEKQEMNYSPEQKKPDIKTNKEGIDKDTNRKVKQPLYSSDTYNRYAITIVYPNVKMLGKNTAISPEEPPRFVFTVPTLNIYSSKFILQRFIDKRLYFGYVKVIVLGKDIVYDKRLFREAIDGVMRDNDFRRSNLIFLSETTARDTLNTIPLTNTITGIFLSQIGKNANIFGRSYSSTVGEVTNTLINGNVAVISRVEPGIQWLKSSGVAVIKDYKFVGWLDENKTIIYSMMMNKIKNEVINVFYKGYYIPFTLTYVSTSKSIDVKKKIKITYKIKVEGEISEFFLNNTIKLLDNSNRMQIQKNIASWIKGQGYDLVNILQNKYNADIIGAGDLLSKYKPKIWKKLEKNWDKEFKNIEVVIEPHVYIRRSGITQ